MEDKNHDYGEAWREMRVSSQPTILQNCFVSSKLKTIKGKTIVSEALMPIIKI
jgi:hypothetical protein